jgi:hypothetical protein
MADVQSIVAQINGSENKDQIIDILQQVLAMLQNSPGVMPDMPQGATSPLAPGATSPLAQGATSPLSQGATPPLSQGATSPLAPGATPPLAPGATPSSMSPTDPLYKSKLNNTEGLTRMDALKLINAVSYDSSGFRNSGFPTTPVQLSKGLSSKYIKGQEYLNSNKTNGAMLRFNSATKKYEGGRRRRRTRR